MYTATITRSLLLLMLLAICCSSCCNYRTESVHCMDEKKHLINPLRFFKLTRNESQTKMKNLNIRTKENADKSERMKMTTANNVVNIRARRNAGSDDSEFIAISSTKSTSAISGSFLPTPTSASFSPFFGLKRLPTTERTTSAANYEDWKPIAYSLAATTKQLRKSETSAKAKDPPTTTATTKTLNSVFNVTAKEKINDDDGFNSDVDRTVADSIIYGVPKEKEVSTSSAADLSLKKQDSVVHDINYYQTLSKRDGGTFKKSFVAFNGGFGATHDGLQLMGQYYSLSERNTKRQEESVATWNSNTKLATADTRINTTDATASANNNKQNNNRTVDSANYRKDVLLGDEAIHNETAASSEDGATKHSNTWLEIASSDGAALELGNQSRRYTEQQQAEQKDKRLQRNETIWPARSPASANGGKEAQTANVTGTGTAIPRPIPARSNLDDIELDDDEALVSIHTTATASTSDSNGSSNSSAPPSKTTICVPMLVREKSSANPELVMDVERVVCFPLPPEMDLNFSDMKNERNETFARNKLETELEKSDDVLTTDVNDVKADDWLAEKAPNSDVVLQSDFEGEEMTSKCSPLQQKSSLFAKTASLLLLLMQAIDLR